MPTTEIGVDTTTNTLVVPHLGISLRCLFGAAVTGTAKTRKRVWKLSYKGANVGSIKVATHNCKGI